MVMRKWISSVTGEAVSEKWLAVFEYVAAIPEGETRTYGDVSLAVYGHKKGAQAVGAALRFWDAESAAEPSFYPQLDDAWDRVVSKQTGSTLYPG